MKAKTYSRLAHYLNLDGLSNRMARILIMLQVFTCAILFASPLAAHPTVATAKDTSVCAGATVPLTGSPSGGTWSGAGVSGAAFNATGLAAGVYPVTYTVTHCKAAVAHVTVNPLPAVTATDTNVCEGGTVPLFGTPCCPIGGTWSGAGVFGIVFIAGLRGPGIYTATYHYSDIHGCTDSAVAHVTINARPTVTTRDTNVCAGASVPLTGFPLGGVWTGEGTSGTVFNSAGLALGHHAVTYTYTDAHRCSSQGYTHITVNPLPAVTASDATVCVGGTVPLFGSPCCPIGGTWSGEGVHGIVFIAGARGPGIYPAVYHYTDSNGCTDSATAHVTINPRPIVKVKDKELCQGSTVHLSGIPSGGTWSGTGVTGTTFNSMGLTPGHYAATYVYTDSNHCSTTESAHIVVKPQPTLTANDTSVCAGSAVALEGFPSGGTWSGYGISGSSFNAAGISPGSYVAAYWMISPGGCVSSTTATVTVNKCGCGCAMKPGVGATEQNGLTAYPNPSAGTFELNLPPLESDAVATMVDIYGRVVDKRVITKSEIAQQVTYNLSSMSAGIYYIRVDNTGSHFSEKIVLK